MTNIIMHKNAEGLVNGMSYTENGVRFTLLFDENGKATLYDDNGIVNR